MLKHKIWARLYVQIAVVFLVFVAVLFVANSNFMYKYYVFKEKNDIKNISEKIDEVDLYAADATEKLSDAISDTNYALSVYDSFGNTLFLSYDSPVADYKGDFNAPEKNIRNPQKSKILYGFSVSEKNSSGTLKYTCKLSGGETLILKTKLSLLKNSAQIANEFITIVAICCLLLTLVWVLFLSRKIAKPIKQMNETANRMAKLDFSGKLNMDSQDELGELATAINILSENLDATLKDLNRKNATLRDEIEAERRIDSMRKGFIANVSHELKTPISIINGYAEAIKLNIGTTSDQIEYAGIIGDEATRMNEMVLNLLELSRLESGKGGITKETYKISLQIKDFIHKFGATVGDAGATLNISVPDALSVCADRQRIGDVLQNYISNAISHVTKGGFITVSAEQSAKNTVKVSVFNTGENIPHDDMEHIWESFFRGERSHKREQDRFGLGLSIVKAVIDAHGGKCGVFNTADGVTFWFEIRNGE